MKARPILFSGAMVRALLAGSKTQTRRIVKPQPEWEAEVRSTRLAGPFIWPIGGLGQQCGAALTKLPYGVPGDLLWVRETVRAEELSRPPQERPATALERQALGRTTVIELNDLEGCDGVRYVANDEWRKIDNTPQAGDAWSTLFYYRGRGKGRIGNPVPGIHMPRWASRLTLEITEVRVERLQDISEADALAEGIVPFDGDGFRSFNTADGGADTEEVTARDAYHALWNTINSKKAPWASNPWVWAVTSTVHKQHVDTLLRERGAA